MNLLFKSLVKALGGRGGEGGEVEGRREGKELLCDLRERAMPRSRQLSTIQTVMENATT